MAETKKVTKSRKGCLTCKKKRLKCDETKPECLKCKSKNILCGGYATNFKWRPFNDDEPRKYEPDSQGQLNLEKQPPNKVNLKRHLELASLSMTGKSIKDIKRENDLISQGLNPDSYKKQKQAPKSNESASTYKQQSGSPSYTLLQPASPTYTLLLSTSPTYTLLLPADPNLSSVTYSQLQPPSPSARRMRRSNSTNTYHVDKPRRSRPRGMSHTELRHSSSDSLFNDSHNEQLHADLQSLRMHHKANGLQSLAEAAVDEINRSPPPGKGPPSPFAEYIKQEDFKDFKELEGQDKQISRLEKQLRDQHQNQLENPTQLEKQQNQLEKHLDSQFEKHHKHDKQAGDIDLTPSISALINFAFNEEVMSPLALSVDEPMTLNMSDLTLAKTSPEDFVVNRIFTTGGFSSPGYGSPVFVSSPADSLSQRSLMQSSEQQQILYLYYQYTCSIMSIKNGVDENPWRNMIIPLASRYPCLYNSIASMTLFHLAGNASLSTTAGSLRSKGYGFMKRCVMDLASGLSKSSDTELPADIALTTCLNLAVSESWDTQILSGIAHLKGARSLIQKVLLLLKEQQATLRSKRKRLLASKISADEYNSAVDSSRASLQTKLVLLENSEWDQMVQMLGDDDDAHSGPVLAVIPKSLSFLFNIWIYFEVLAQMTTESVSDDKGIDLVASITAVLEKNKKLKQSHPQKRFLWPGSESSHTGTEIPSPSMNSESSSDGPTSINGGSTPGYTNVFDHFESFTNHGANTDYVDPLLGCSQSLFLVMGKVAGLISKIRKARMGSTRTKRNSLAIITAATQLKLQLLEWKPTITLAMMEQVNCGAYNEHAGTGNTAAGSTWDISSCIATAEAYRYASLLYLHQAVPEVPSLSSHRLAEKIFVLMASIPTSSHLYVVHIFPLLISSCEAEPGDEREWCEERWALLAEKMWIGNIDRAFEVVKEVWRRKDEHKKSEGAKDTRTEGPTDHTNDISSQLSGLMAAVNSDLTYADDVGGGISSKLHWSTVMKEWGWEVLLG